MPADIAAAAPAEDWIAIDPGDLLVIELAPDTLGKVRRVVIQLMPPPFSQDWVGNIRQLALAKWWDGTSINRVQDNYVVQWGDASEKKPLPDGISIVAQSQYTFTLTNGLTLPDVVPQGVDAYGVSAMFRGWPVAYSLSSQGEEQQQEIWPVHCYGMVGVGRGMPPDSGTGAELYAVIGQSPRHLDRNMALVGRVIEGIELLSSLPRGTGKLGFYEDEKDRLAITSVRLGSELPEGELNYQYLSTDSDSFARYSNAQANRRDPFFIRPAGGTDICNIPVPIRRVKSGG